MAGRWQNAVIGTRRWRCCATLAARRSWLLPAGLALGVLVGCASTPRHTPLSPTLEVPSPADSGTLDQYATAIKANSDRSDHVSDGNVRAELAAQSSSMADHCLALNAQAAPCQYAKALATGMEARAHPTQALGLLKSMLQNLDAAAATDPNYDMAGPSRVRALVLIRAPGWPLGPGDPDAGLEAARKAVSLQPDYPPNALALAEALSKTGDAKGAHDSYQHALDLVQAAPAGPERDGWVHDAQEGLARK
jgi:tetratricopeptide (TPR) repeat protein